MLGYYFPRFAAFWRNLRLVALLAAFCTALGFQRSCEPSPSRPGINSVLPAAQAAGLPSATVFELRARPSSWTPGDTSRGLAAGDLQRKMLPRARWGTASGYLVGPRPKRPRQRVLDSLASAARHAK